MTTTTRTLWFPSKIDWWLALVLVAAPGIALVGGLSAAPDERLAALGALAVLAATYLGLVFPMSYGITDSELVVRHGLIRQRIRLADIMSVTPTHNPLSSPALSLDRLRITSGSGKSVMISPARKREFMIELALRARLVRKGDGLVRG